MAETTKEAEKHKVENSYDDISEIRRDMAEVKQKMYETYIALIGSAFTKDGGLVARVIDSEIEVEKLNIRVEGLEKKVMDHEQQVFKKNVFVNIIWGMAASLLTIIISAIVYYNFKK